MSRRRTKQIIAIIVLLLLLAMLTVAYVNYRTTRKTSFDISVNTDELLPKPTYLYSFSGAGAKRLVRPLGVLVADGRVYVTDARRGVLDVFTPEGNRVAEWGKGKLKIPLYVAKHPKTGDIWVTDRRVRAIVIFDKNGKVKGEFNPNLPKSELPKFDSKGFQWAPLALAFAPDGTLYVTEILNGHRFLIFDPDGKFKRAVGTAGLANQANQSPSVFQFPNGIKVLGTEVWVADSNNRRIQVFDRNGDFKRFVVTQGLPRGFDFLPRRDKEPQRLVVVDTLSHDATIWDAAKAEKVVQFGEQGVLEAEFSYPNDASVDAKRKIFIADTANGRVQVWGWPAEAAVIRGPETPAQWALCLSPLLLIPLLLFLRKREYFTTDDFVFAIVEAGNADLLVQRRVRWMITPDHYELVKSLDAGEVDLANLLEPTEHSDSDARALQERFEIDYERASMLALAQRAQLFCTEDLELRRIGRVLELDVVDHEEYVERFRKDDDGGPATPVASTVSSTPDTSHDEDQGTE